MLKSGVWRKGAICIVDSFRPAMSTPPGLDPTSPDLTHPDLSIPNWSRLYIDVRRTRYFGIWNIDKGWMCAVGGFRLVTCIPPKCNSIRRGLILPRPLPGPGLFKVIPRAGLRAKRRVHHKISYCFDITSKCFTNTAACTVHVDPSSIFQLIVIFVKKLLKKTSTNKQKSQT